MRLPNVYFYCLGCDPLQPDYTSGNTIRICKSFLDKLWRDPAYDECGVMYSNPCPSSWGDDQDFDPYQCGDTLVLPKQAYNGNVTHFINVFKPPGLEDYDFVSVDDVNTKNHEACWIARTYSNSAGSSRLPTGTWVGTALLAVSVAALQLLL